MQLISEGKNYSLGTTCGRARIPKEFELLPFNKIVVSILGKNAEVGVVFIRESQMKTLNKKYRKLDKSTDILSFPGEEGGEILFSINDVARKAREFGMEKQNYLSFLLIHGLLHLKGMLHSSKMESKEREFCKKFGIESPALENKLGNKNAQTNNNRNRHRHLRSKSDSRSTRRRE